jgi:hypothetical protein
MIAQDPVEQILAIELPALRRSVLIDRAAILGIAVRAPVQGWGVQFFDTQELAAQSTAAAVTTPHDIHLLCHSISPRGVEPS